MKQFQNADREFILRWLAPSNSLDFPKALKVCYLSYKQAVDPFSSGIIDIFLDILPQMWLV